ncbi:MAG: response regulator transcription factor [Chloroflexi bacterium]|nr:response regulator transcription factor [Chloroflexota bacterium]
MKKIMVVDDDVEATKLLGGILRHQGYEVIAVNDSTVAAQIAGEERPNMFLLDLMMPVIDGFKLCRLLREDRKFMVTPIIIVTALTDEDSKAVAFGAGANDYLSKPYHPRQLLTIIKELLEPGT